MPGGCGRVMAQRTNCGSPYGIINIEQKFDIKRGYSVITITTAHGKQIAILSQAELHDPRDLGERVRAYCHIHGSDHQRSLSIDKTTGWGYCFNAVCHAKV